jgi:uncharacterized protein YegP (UPF0339 family)
MPLGTYLLHKPGSQYHWDLRGGNSEPILSSETYTTKQNALNGIQSCRDNSPHDIRYERKIGTGTQPYYFVLKAGNGEPIGRSEMYSTTTARDNGIESCKKNGPTATLVDRT